MMKRIVLIILLLGPFVLDALPGDTKLKSKHRRIYELAEFYFAEANYHLSKKYYEELLENYPKEGYFHHKLGIAHLEMDDKSRAKDYLVAAVSLDKGEAHYHLAKCFHRLEKFDKAISHYEEYMQLPNKNVTDAKLSYEIQRVKNARYAYKNPVAVTIKNVGDKINSSYKDYVPLINANGDQLIFTSRRPGSTGELLDPNDRPFEDIYLSKKLNGEWTDPVQFGPPINTVYHDANVCYSANGASLIIYRSEKHRESGDLHISHFVDQLWTEPERLPKSINTPYHEPSAALSPDGKRMYLVSDRPGSLGERDLFMVNKLPNGDWSEPKNLGRTLNTNFNEDAPFVDPSGTYLYFSSEGHNSLGGFDIYRARILEDGMVGPPVNMGYPINTVEDDIYFSITSDGKTAYYSSEKSTGGVGSQDIYEIDFIFEVTDHVIVKGLIKNDLGLPVEAEVELNDEEGNLLEWYSCDPDKGKFVIPVLPDRVYVVKAVSKGFVSHQEIIQPRINSKGEFTVLDLDIVLAKENE